MARSSSNAAASIPAAKAGPDQAAGALGSGLYERSFMTELLRLREGMKSHFRSILKTHDMTDQNWRILKVVVDYGPIEVTQISRAAVIPPASLSRILPKMEAAALVARSSNPDDMRRTMIESTAKGRALHAAITPRMRDAYIKVASVLDADLLRQLEAIVGELNRQLYPEAR